MAVKTNNLALFARQLILFILLTSVNHISVQFVDMLSRLQLISSQ